MSNSQRITLSTEHETPLQFDAELKGSNEDAMIYLYVKTDDMCLGFKCQHEHDNQWFVTVPALDQYLNKGRYDFCVCVYIDKYYFTPVEGKARVTDKQTPHVSFKQDDEQTTADQEDTVSEPSVEQEDNQDQQPTEQNESTLNEDTTPMKTINNKPHSFFSGGSPSELAKRIRSMPTTNQTDNTVRKILEDYKRDKK